MSKQKLLLVKTDLGDISEVQLDQITLENLQHLVNGYIEPCTPAELSDAGIIMLANEEGVLYGLPVNENLTPFFFVGDLVFVGIDGCDFCGLTDGQIKFGKNWISSLNIS